MAWNWLKTRQTKYSAYLTVYILVVLAALTVANYLANRYNKSYDSTSNKRFSLSQQTENVVRNLKQDVTITYYDQTTQFAQAKDVLDRYGNLSPKLNVVYVDPVKKPQLAKAAGIRTIPTIMIQAGTRTQEAKGLTESELTSAIIRTLKGEARTVCVVEGSGEPRLDDTGGAGFSGLKQLLEGDNYKTRTISLIEQTEIPGDCTILMVGGPRKDYSEPAAAAIQKYVENGGRAWIMLTPPLNTGKDVVARNEALIKMLEGWGATVNPNLIMDARGQRLNLGAEVAVIGDYGTHAIGSDLKGTATVFPLSRSIDVKATDKVQTDSILTTGSSTVAVTDLNAREIRVDQNKDKRGPFTIGIAGTYNTGKENKNGRFVVVGGSDWASNAYLGITFFGNRDLALNMANWLSADEDLISIRPKAPEDRRLNLSVGGIALIKYFSIFLIPAFAIAAGVAVWLKRR